MPTSSPAELWEELAAGAARESPLWADSLLPGEERQPLPVFSSLAAPHHALGVETIYEGYLVHYGRPRLFAPADANTALLLGDYLYAHGLVRIAAAGDVAAVHDLAELISLCAALRADGVEGDGAAWAATAALLGGDGLEEAREALRVRRDAGPLERLARAAVGDGVDAALAAHHDLLR